MFPSVSMCVYVFRNKCMHFMLFERERVGVHERINQEYFHEIL